MIKTWPFSPYPTCCGFCTLTFYVVHSDELLHFINLVFLIIWILIVRLGVLFFIWYINISCLDYSWNSLLASVWWQATNFFFGLMLQLSVPSLGNHLHFHESVLHISSLWRELITFTIIWAKFQLCVMGIIRCMGPQSEISKSSSVAKNKLTFFIFLSFCAIWRIYLNA